MWLRTCPEHTIQVGDLGEARVMGVQGNAATWLSHGHAVVVWIGEGLALQRGPVAQHRQPCLWEALCREANLTTHPKQLADTPGNCRL